jgi:phage shock protein PspC (stress-responsive transcriptional regulator)
LERTADGRLIAGVAGGLARYLGVDVVLVRLAFVLTAFFGGVGVIAYLLGWVALPVAAPTAPVATRSRDRKQLLGYALVAVGLFATGARFGWSVTGEGAFWPLVLITLGAVVLWLRTRDVEDEPASAFVPPAPTPPSTAALPPVPSRAAAAEPSPAWTAPEPVPEPPRPRSYLGPLTWSCLLILAGVAWLVEAADLVDVDLGVVFALALTLVGAALLTSVWFGRSRGLIALGLLLALIVGAFGLVDVPLEGGIGDPTYRPQSAAALDREYTLAIGNLKLDLSDVDLSGARRRVHAQLGVGEIDVTVPQDVRVVVDGHAGVGGVTAFGTSSDECCPTDVRRVSPGVPGAGTLVLDADVGLGHIDIIRPIDIVRPLEPFRATP